MNTEIQCDTLRSRGYHMTEENVQELQDKALGQYTRLKATLAAAKARIEKTGSEMSQVASELRSKPAQHWIGFSFANYPWLNGEAIQKLAHDLETAQKEVEDAKIKAINLGVTILN